MKLLLTLAIATLLFVPFANACKDIIVTNNATKGDYNLLMKVRDPSRPGLQVLFIADKGYEYSYHNPWKNEPWIFRLAHKIIGTATQGDTPPNMIKAGMMMSDAGMAYGDADSPTLYINPTHHAWDDFDWLLYAAENASNEDEAIQRLKQVSDMHACGVGENLFVVGPRKAYVAEGDAFHFVYREISGIEVQSNYPKMLWNNRMNKKIIASSFDTVYEGYVKKWQVVRLGGLAGFRITKIGTNWIMARAIPFGEKIKVGEGEGAKIGNFWVQLIECEGKRAKIRACYEYYEWENEIKRRLNTSVGVQELMNISRLTIDDLHGLRGMAEGSEKATMIFKIPLQNYEELTMAWFAPDAIASIYVPVHIADLDIHNAYENGEAAQLAVTLLQKFGSFDFSRVERVFINENARVEKIAPKNPAQILTASDTSMQAQAIMIEKAVLAMPEEKINKFISLWKENYYETIKNMEKNLGKMDASLKKTVTNIALEMCEARIQMEKIANGSDYTMQYERAKKLAQRGEYRESFGLIKSIFSKTDESLFGIKHEKKSRNDITAIALMTIAVLFMTMIYIKRRR